jgi:hypothetical protein
MIETNKLHQDIGQYAFEKPIPGQSLTNSPDQSYPWEGAPQLTSSKEAIQKIFLELLKDENLELFADLMAKKVPVADLATMIGMASFTNGKMNPDLMLPVLEPTMYMLLTIAEKLGIEPVLYRGEEKDDLQTMPQDKSDIDKTLADNQKLNEKIKLKDLKVSKVNKSSVGPDISKQLEDLDLSKVKESLLQKPQAAPQPESLLGKA